MSRNSDWAYVRSFENCWVNTQALPLWSWVWITPINRWNGSYFYIAYMKAIHRRKAERKTAEGILHLAGLWALLWPVALPHGAISPASLLPGGSLSYRHQVVLILDTRVFHQGLLGFSRSSVSKPNGCYWKEQAAAKGGYERLAKGK